MAEFTPQTIPLGSLADAAAAGAGLAQQELYAIAPTSPTSPIGPITTTGIIARPPITDPFHF